MIIDVFSWHARWYGYWLTYGRGVKPGYQVNLCHYVRVLLFWAPMTWLDRVTNVGYWGPKVVVVIWALSIVGGIGLWITILGLRYPTTFLKVIGSLAGAIAMVAVLCGISRFVVTHRLPSIPTLGIPTTTRLIFAYGKAKKHRICPFITFE